MPVDQRDRGVVKRYDHVRNRKTGNEGKVTIPLEFNMSLVRWDEEGWEFQDNDDLEVLEALCPGCGGGGHFQCPETGDDRQCDCGGHGWVAVEFNA